jgi:FtsH-binding integral membrane protein
MFATVETKLWRTASEVNAAMVRIYNHMLMAIVTSGLVSYLISSSPGLMTFFFTGFMKWVVLFAPLAFVFLVPMLLNAGISRVGKVLTLHAFAGLMGLSFATIFAVFNMGSIVSAFMGAAILFGIMSAYGYFTKKDLSGLGSLLFVGLIAIIIASIFNIVMASFWPGAIDNLLFSMVISALAIVIFLGLTAYDTQRIREMVSEETDDSVEITGAITLYLNFINLFLSLLQLFGEKKE